jgi:hypothetical protein
LPNNIVFISKIKPFPLFKENSDENIFFSFFVILKFSSSHISGELTFLEVCSRKIEEENILLLKFKLLS